LHLLDVETSGVTEDDLVRSISIGGGQVSSVGGVKQYVSTPGDERGARMITRQMQGQVSADPADLTRQIGFGEAVALKETKFGSSLAKRIHTTGNTFDLTTSAGRIKAAEYYKNLFTEMNQDGHYLATYNAQFDVAQLLKSARALDEFAESGGEAIAAKFEEKMANGGAIDILGLARQQLGNKLAARLEAFAGTPEEKALYALQSTFSANALMRSRTIGESVSPRGLQNIIESSNLLKLMAESGDPEQLELLQRMATSHSGHIDISDRQAAEALLGHMENLDVVGPEGLDLSGLPAAIVNLIKRAQFNVSASRAQVTTVALSDPRYLTQEAFEHVTSDEGIKAVELGVLDYPGLPSGQGTIKFDRETEEFRLFTPSGSTALPASINAPDLVRSTVTETRNLPPEADINPNIVVQTLGVSPIDVTQITLINAAKKAGTTSLIDSAGTNIAANESTLIEALGATRQYIGFPFMPETANFGASVTGLMRQPHNTIIPEAKDAYGTALAKAGIIGSTMDPQLASTATLLAETTAPILEKNKGLIRSIIRGSGKVPASGLDAATEAASEQLSGKLGMIGELKAIAFESQKTSSVSDTVLMASHAVQSRMKTLTDTGEVVPFLSQRARASRSNAVRFSQVAGKESLINVVYGGDIVKEGGDVVRRARVEAQSYYEAIQDIFKTAAPSRSPQEMIAAGLVQTEQQANLLLGFMGGERNKVIDKIASLRQQRGMVIGSIGGESGEAAEIGANFIAGLRSIASGLDSDTIAVQAGLVGQITDMGEEGGVATIRMSDKALQEAERIGDRELIRRSSAGSQRGFLRSVMGRMIDDEGFTTRIAESRAERGLETSIGGEGTLASRLLRDKNLTKAVENIKPKVYKTAVAAAALTAGYYLGRRNKKNKPYDEVMAPQPTEPGPMSTRDFNAVDQQFAAQSSSRRDPLVTAGVVGNLDRNKIGHTQMGANKYNHLYGA
jgi:hypothetical protein